MRKWILGSTAEDVGLGAGNGEKPVREVLLEALGWQPMGDPQNPGGHVPVGKLERLCTNSYHSPACRAVPRAGIQDRRGSLGSDGTHRHPGPGGCQHAGNSPGQGSPGGSRGKRGALADCASWPQAYHVFSWAPFLPLARRNWNFQTGPPVSQMFLTKTIPWSKKFKEVLG